MRHRWYRVLDPDGGVSEYEFGGRAREHADRTGGRMVFVPAPVGPVGQLELFEASG